MIYKKLLIIAVAVLAVFAAAAAYLYFEFSRPLSHETAVFVVQRGMPLSLISEQLYRAGVVTNPKLFSIFGRLKGVDRKLKAGEYEFEDSLSMRDVMAKLSEGKCKLYKVTLIEGWTMKEMAAYLETLAFGGAAFRDDFLKLALDAGFAKSQGIDEPTLEGYLFPNTYLIERPRGADSLVDSLVTEFKKNYLTEFEARARELGMTRHDVVTLASIIEKETGAEQERAIVSSVFHNRLKKGMPLQSDPTVIYAIKDFDGNIRKSDLSNPSPYNTYVHAGLPPGPIANPGLASIKAALWPASTNYLFFVSRNDGTHEFNETYAAHAKAVDKFQR